MHKALIIIAALITVILLGPYVGIHVLGTRPALEAPLARQAPSPPPAAERTPRSEAKRKPDHPPQNEETTGESGKLSEIEELLR